MPRGRNFFYQQDPTAAIASGLVRAIFGDPQMAAQQQLQQAEMDQRAAQAERDRAAAGFDVSRTTGQDTANRAQLDLPSLTESWVRANQPPQPQVQVDSPEFADFDTPLPKPEPRPDAGSALAALVAAMGQQQGDKIDPRHIMGSLASFAGDDELARRGLIAQGHTPTDDFALTPERADAIAEQGYNADLMKALGVAEINNRDDVPVANIRADASRDVATINNRDDIPVANIRADASRDVAGIKAAGRPVSDAGNVARTLFPGVRVTQVRRDPNSALGRANPSSWHTRSGGAVDVAPIPGMTFESYVQRYRDAGYQIIEARDEVRNPSGHATGPHWHIVLGEGGGRRSAASKPPKAVTPAQDKALREELARRIPGFESGRPGAQAYLLSLATENFQRTGNFAGAVTAAIDENRRRAQSRRQAPAQASGGQPTVVDPVRQEAMQAIAAGAPRAAVAQRYREMTGRAL
jgi:hypothetical protein